MTLLCKEKNNIVRLTPSAKTHFRGGGLGVVLGWTVFALTLFKLSRKGGKFLF